MALSVPAAQSVDRITASVDGRTILLNGKPVFPVIAWAQCAEDVEENLAIGVNVFMGIDCSPQKLIDAIAGRAYVVPDYQSFVGLEFPGLIGYHLPDEPEGHGIPPEDLPKSERVQKTGRLIFLTVTAHFANEQAPISPTVGKDVYAQYFSLADVIGFDLYPLSHLCGNPQIGIASVYHEQRDLVRLVGGKPTFQWIEVNGLEQFCGEDPMTPELVRAEAWLAIAGGATGLGYFTHGWPKGIWTHFYVAHDVAAAITVTNQEIQKLASVLLAPQLSVSSQAGDPVKIGGRVVGNAVYLIAVNASDQPVLWNRQIRSMPANAVVSVYGESRTLKARSGWLKDRFGPYEVRLYTWNQKRRQEGASFLLLLSRGPLLRGVLKDSIFPW